MNGETRQLRRVLHFLLAGEARAMAAADDRCVLLEVPGRGTISVRQSWLRQLAASDLIRLAGEKVELSPAGRSWLKRDGHGAEGFARQHGDWDMVRLRDGTVCRINLAESPLAALARLRDKSGKAYLEGEQVRAGERLRADFTHGQLAPRSGVNWASAGASGSGHGGGAAELADSVVAARQRANRALAAVGPELAGVLVDVCCFLKGLGEVETERGWPVRSAKLMLRTALAALARHYAPALPRTARQGLRHWGDEDFRPLSFSGSDS